MSDSESDANTRPVAPQSGPFPTIPDCFDPAYKDTGDDEKTNIHGLGLNEDVTVGNQASIAGYGLK
jgi:hypothetical protein